MVTGRKALVRQGRVEIAMERVLDELVSVLKQIGTELAAGTREVVERIEVELAGKLSDDTAWLTWSACIGRGASSLLQVQAHG